MSGWKASFLMLSVIAIFISGFLSQDINQMILEDGEYKTVLVAIDEEVEEDPTIIDKIKHASWDITMLHRETSNEAVGQTVTTKQRHIGVENVDVHVILSSRNVDFSADPKVGIFALVQRGHTAVKNADAQAVIENSLGSVSTTIKLHDDGTGGTDFTKSITNETSSTRAMVTHHSTIEMARSLPVSTADMTELTELTDSILVSSTGGSGQETHPTEPVVNTDSTLVTSTGGSGQETHSTEPVLNTESTLLTSTEGDEEPHSTEPPPQNPRTTEEPEEPSDLTLIVALSLTFAIVVFGGTVGAAFGVALYKKRQARVRPVDDRSESYQMDMTEEDRHFMDKADLKDA